MHGGALVPRPSSVLVISVIIFKADTLRTSTKDSIDLIRGLLLRDVAAGDWDLKITACQSRYVTPVRGGCITESRLPW